MATAKEGESHRIEELMEARRSKLSQLRQRAGDAGAFPNDFQPDSSIDTLVVQFGDCDAAALAAAPECSLCGRIMRRRVMGKASFMTLQDSSGSVQVYLQKDVLNDAYGEFKNSDIGDLVGIRGTLMRTQKGEFTVKSTAFRLLVKSLRPLPDKYHGLTDREAVGRQRYLDLLLNGQDTVRHRAAMNREIRTFLDERGYLEVETPMMHPIPGGANARPFITHHNSLNRDLYLRVAPELYLKQLLVGGLDRVYELNRNFRNEGISARHNPEFTMLEFYRCWADWTHGMTETEQMLHHLAVSLTGSSLLQAPDSEQGLDFSLPFERQSMVSAVAKKLGVETREINDWQKLQRIAAPLLKGLEGEDTQASEEDKKDMKRRAWKDWSDWGQLLLRLFEKAVEPDLHQPVFITHFPLSVSPLARPCHGAAPEDGGDHKLAERWELLIGGREIAGGFSELNDAEDQAGRLGLQAERKREGDDEAMHFDRSFIEALEYGMPPATGVGVGLDRLLMLLTGTASVRDVILFPQLRPSTDRR